MSKTVDQAIDELVAEISALDAELRKKKETVNTLCSVAERDPLFLLSEPGAVPTSIRADQFYGQPLASAVRTILEMRKQQDLGAAPLNEIYDALVAGGYQFNTKTEDVAKASLRNSLSKNTVTFHKLPNGRFGLLAWYPKVKSPAEREEVEEEEEEELEVEDAGATETVADNTATSDTPKAA